MTHDYFKRLLKGNNAIQLNDEYIVFNDLELYSFITRHGIKNNTFEELFERKIGDITVGQLILNTEEFAQEYDGGRGSSSSNGKMGGGFGHADQRGRGNPDEKLLPAELNLDQASGNSVKKVLKRFNDKKETIDDLFQVGCIGLMKAIDNFDLSHNVRFSTYACPMIIGEIRRHLRDNGSL